MVEVELLKLGIPWNVLERSGDERILMYWAVVTEQAKLETDATADRVASQKAQMNTGRG